MQALTPITPLESGVEMFQRGKLQPFFTARTEKPRPLSEATEIFDTDWEDEESEFEEDSAEESPKYSFESSDSRRRSETTISSYDEVQTPHSSGRYEPLFYRNKPVEGPKGPHLFRASQSSTDFQFEYALQLSPLMPKQMTLPPRADTAFQVTHSPTSPSAWYQMPSLNAAMQEPEAFQESDEVRKWTAQKVAAWMFDQGFEDSIIEKFEAHDITGAVLLDLQFDDLKELEIHSFGKRHRLWNEIEILRGNDGKAPSPTVTPFQDISRPATRIPRANSTRNKSRARGRGEDCDENDNIQTPITPGGGRRRRARKHRNHNDPITPAESVSIVAIEQLLPKPHKCAKGERCHKWRRQQRQLQRLHEEHGFPVSPEKGGHIFIAGNPGNASSAENLVQNVHRQPSEENVRPTSDAVPSVVASSDLLGPGQLPEFALQEDNLRFVGSRDPQDNVKQFLTLQGLEPPSIAVSAEEPPTPPLDMFPPMHQQSGQPNLQPPLNTPAPPAALKSLPKLTIPRSASAAPQQRSAGPQLVSASSFFSPCRTALSPGGAQPRTSIYRFGTPASEMDVPVTAMPPEPLSRDTSQSVPPSMQYRDPICRTLNQSRASVRRPSFALPRLGEDEVFSPQSPHSGSHPGSSASTLHENNPDAAATTEEKKVDDNASASGVSISSSKKPKKQVGFKYEGVAHAGWMKKRRTRLLRHEWQDHHFRLTGTRLAMHPNELPTSSAVDTIDVDDYAVACSSLASNKLAAKLKALKIGQGKHGDPETEAFSFQLVPTKGGEGIEKRTVHHHGGAKTHHFAVKTRDERIDWMRELMLAKALKAKGEGYVVEVNGTAV